MPTLNPRVQVTLSPSLDVLVSRLAGLQKSSKSQVLRELLEAAEPALQRAVALMDAASRVKAQVHTGLGESLLRSQERIEDVLAGTMARVDTVVSDLVSQAEAVKGRRQRATAPRSGGAASPPSNPPASNRGVKSGPKRAKGGTPKGGQVVTRRGRA